MKSMSLDIVRRLVNLPEPVLRERAVRVAAKGNRRTTFLSRMKRGGLVVFILENEYNVTELAGDDDYEMEDAY